MGVQDIGEKSDLGEHLEHRRAEECVSFAVIELTVKSLAGEIIFVVDKVVGHLILYKAVNAAILLTPSKVRVKFSLFFHFGAVFLADGGIKRHNDSDVNSLCGKSLGERAENVTESARSRKRHNLRAYEKNTFFHIFKSLLCNYTITPLPI